jgi:hypothetical protein
MSSSGGTISKLVLPDGPASDQMSGMHLSYRPKVESPKSHARVDAALDFGCWILDDKTEAYQTLTTSTTA